MGYGHKELLYAEPFANALVENDEFRSWILKRTKFAPYADSAKVLAGEMLAQRSVGTKYWWRSHYTESCRCFGCSGHETDLLAIFEDAKRERFALHVEVKHPGDSFKKENQARAYPERAKCWVRNPPAPVLVHSDATTALLFSDARRGDYGGNLRHFDVRITFEDIRKEFPDMYVLRPL